MRHMIGPAFDAMVYRLLAQKRAQAATAWPADQRLVATAAGPLCVRDSGGALPPLVIAVASPCVIAHYDALYEALRSDFRVIVFDMPGFGFSAPRARDRHRLAEGSAAIVALIDALDVRNVTLACASSNGLYAIAASQRLADRLARMVLLQTPDSRNMKAWFARITQGVMRTPGIGQYVNFISRRRFPPVWYRIAVADRARHAAFTEPAQQALEAGGCYCFASFVQGMLDMRDDDPLLCPPPELPVTAIWGMQDRTHRKTDPAAVRHHCPQAEIIRLDTVGHYPDLEAPEAFAALLRERVPTPTS